MVPLSHSLPDGRDGREGRRGETRGKEGMGKKGREVGEEGDRGEGREGSVHGQSSWGRKLIGMECNIGIALCEGHCCLECSSESNLSLA